MMSAARAHQQTRRVWLALTRSGAAEASLSCGQESSLRCLGSFPAASRINSSGVADSDDQLHDSYAASCSGRSLSATNDQCTGSFGASSIPSYALSSLTTAKRNHVLAALSSSRTSGILAPTGGLTSSASPLGCRSYHTWYYGSKIRNRAVNSANSLDQLASVLRQEGDRLDHMNLAAFLRRLQLAGAAEAASATASALAAVSSSSSSSPVGGTSTGGAQAQPQQQPSTAVAPAVVAAAAGRAVQRQVFQLAAEASWLARRRAKWCDPRYAALVVSRTALLGHTDNQLLDLLTSRVLARLSEAYSRDLLLLLRGLHAHQRLAASKAHASQPELQSPPATTAPAASAARGPKKPFQIKAKPSTPYAGTPEELMGGVRTFLLAKLPTGRMPPENLDGLLRYSRALSGRPVGPDLCTAAAEDLRRRLPIYAPGPLAGLLSTLAAERHPVEPALLDAAASQFATHASTYGTGAAAARFLASAATILRNQQQPQQPQQQLEGGGNSSGAAAVAAAAPSPGEWIASRLDLLAECLSLMARNLPYASPDQLRLWLQALARVEAPLAQLSAGGAAAATPASAAAGAFVRAHAVATERSLAEMGAEGASRLRKAYDVLGLPYPKGL